MRRTAIIRIPICKYVQREYFLLDTYRILDFFEFLKRLRREEILVMYLVKDVDIDGRW